MIKDESGQWHLNKHIPITLTLDIGRDGGMLGIGTLRTYEKKNGVTK